MYTRNRVNRKKLKSKWEWENTNSRLRIYDGSLLVTNSVLWKNLWNSQVLRLVWNSDRWWQCWCLLCQNKWCTDRTWHRTVTEWCHWLLFAASWSLHSRHCSVCHGSSIAADVDLSSHGICYTQLIASSAPCTDCRSHRLQSPALNRTTSEVSIFVFVQQSFQPKLPWRRYGRVSWALQNSTVFSSAQN